jgi:4-hydroxy-tetrahydrodipicolinate synthase
MVDIKGVIPALTTPFNEARELDLPAYRKLVDLVVDDGVHGLLVAGCTGEAWALTDEERSLIYAAAVKGAKKRVPVIAGCGAMAPTAVMANIKLASKAGCDAALVQPPWYILLSQDEIHDFYMTVASSSPLPIILYNIPRRTGVSLSPDLVARLADHDNIIGLKESSKDYLVMSEMIRKAGDRISIYAGYANLLGVAALTSGAVGYMDSSTPVLGKRSVAFFDSVMRGDLQTAREHQTAMSNLNDGFFGNGTFPASVKAGLELLGRPGGWPRDPIKPLNREQRAKIARALTQAGLMQENAPLAKTA